uniref:Midasin n=1 Tax=Cyprinodon variegatus TaxID=28743 RepID=A0A3Q2D7A0_CYPVA
MENLEVSLSALTIISRHVDKSRNQISQYLSKQLQIWTQQDRQSILDYLAQLLLEKDYTLLVARHVRPLILDLLERSADRVKAGGRINHDLHERLCVALSRLLSISPDAHFAVRYFSSAPPVFQRLFFTSEQSAAVRYGPRRMKLRDLMAATLRFLQSDCATFRKLWDWSPCVSQLLTSDVMVRSTAQCLALVCHMTDNQKAIFLRNVLTNDEILHMKMALEESRQMEAEKALVLANPRSVRWHQDLAHRFTRGQVVSEDLSPNVVAVCGVVLPRMAPRHVDQVDTNLVLVDSTCQNLRRLALAVASHKAVLLEGPIGCGKTALVEFMAAVTGHTKAADILKVQLGDQTDSKMLLGMYRCTDVPGKFVWQPGTLTQAVSKGLWILLEDIDHAPLDVISVLLPLMENRKLMIPGREDCIEVASGFQFFATRSGNWHKPQNSHAALLDKYWTKLQMGNMSQAELKKVLVHRYPMLAAVSDRLLDIYCQLTGDRHSEVDPSSMEASSEGQQEQPEDKSSSLEGRADLLKWCERISVNFDSSSSATAQRVFLEALDCFTAMLSLPASRLRMAEIIGSKLNISKEKFQAQHFCQLYQPSVSLTELQAAVGRAALTRKQAEAVQLSSKQTFAATRPAAVLLEQLAVCVAKGEPVLLVGETGTGKTSTVQHLASITHKLRVVNMNQQSDTADLLGYKPVDHRQILLPLREAFEELFSQTYSRKQNLTFLGHVQTCFREKRWQDLLRLMDHVCKSALAKELEEKAGSSLLGQWEALTLKLSQTQQQIRACETAMVFAFVEGSLAQAVKKGHWILLDEINLAAAETLECLSGLLEGSAGSLVLLDRGDTPLVRHPDFRLFACMNPATDVGKRNLPLGLRNFTELYVHELENEGDLRILVSDYLKCLNPQKSVISGIIFYLAARKEASSRLLDGTGHRPHYSLRTLCRALSYAAANPCHSVQRSLYEGFCMSFLTQLDRSSHPLVQNLVCQHILMGNTKCLKQPIPAPPGRACVQMEGYWVPQGELEPALDPSYILTASVKLNLRDLSRVVSATHPVLIQGETSVGKTSLIRWLATATGNQCVRINNHEHTDIQEYIGCYSSDDRGKLVFKEVLIDAMRKGYWVILDELNLAPTDVLEALNRLLDDNRELFVAETQEVIKAHPRFMLFATQNPPGLYGGRKVLSRAFRNRFVELHFDELPSGELETILHQRCSLPPSYCSKLVKVMLDLQSLRRGSSVFAGKHGFITLRDLFRWAERYRLEEQTQASQDWLQHLADDYMLLAGRVRKPEEEAVILATLQKHFKRTVNPENLFSHKQLISQFGPLIDSGGGVPDEFRHVVWTQGLRRIAVLIGRALRFGESVLLVGDTCGKTTICQLYAALAGQKFFSVNCHMHMETSDFLGGLRPVRYAQQTVGEEVRLFEWTDGPLVLAMKEGGVFLMDEISLADDSVLERLNVLETEKSLVLAEKGSGDDDDVELIRAAAGFRLVATMNPGGDFGKKEGPQTDGRSLPQYAITAGTAAMNAQRLLRALKLQRPVLLEGSPGVGKTSLVAALAKASGNHLVRINLSEQTDVTDLFGTDLPVEGGKGGEFAWRDGPLLAALKAGHWVVLDELNLASQSVLEGLNACFDHRAEIYIPELGMSFQVQHEKTKIFGCQNPFTQGGGRKGLPKSFLNRFTQVFVDQLTSKDMEFIGNSIFPSIDTEIIGKMVEFNNRVGFSVLQRSGGAPVTLDPPLSVTHQCLKPLESLMKCVDMGWMTIVVGPTASGKTGLVRLLALLTGHRLRVMAMNSAMDTTELLGGFEQVDIMRPWQQVLEMVDYTVAMVTRRGLMSLDDGTQDTQFLLQTWGVFCQWLRERGLQRAGGTVTSEAVNKLEVIIVLLQKLNTKLKVFTDMSKLQMDFTLLKERLAQLEDGWTNGGFEWLDGMLVQALQAGDWLLMDNVNFCASVLDRLNALLEPNGSLAINERGVIDGKTPRITPHPNFLFLTMDPVHGELSRAMRNRGVEIYIPGEHEGMCWDSLDLKTLLHSAGVPGDCVCELLMQIHRGIRSAIWSPASSVASLLYAASLLSSQLQRGADLRGALQHACAEAYSFCQRTVANQKRAQQVIEEHLAIQDGGDWGDGLLCAGVWPDGLPSALLSTEDSCFSSVLRDGQVLLFCLNSLSLQGKNCPMTLRDLQQAMQSGGVREDSVFSGGKLDQKQGDALRLLPTAVRLVTERASHGDWILRSSWLSHLSKSFKYLPPALVQVEAGNRALKAVFSSSLAVKGRTLAELLQPHSKDEYRILMDMRWNKQYLDILTNQCNFEDEERYTEFLEALNAVANTIDISQLPHPMLMHLRLFFDLWDAYVLQAVQSGLPYISDHVMFEILQLLQWRDRFWDVCVALPADSQGVAVLSLHWQWVQKHLILRLPQLLMGDTASTLGQQELQAVSAAIQNMISTPVSVAAALKGIQRSLGKALPFKLESVAECASRLRLLSKALDANELRLDGSFSSWRQELIQLQGAGLWLDMKESLLEASGLVLSANNQLDPQQSTLEKLVLIVEQQQYHMTSKGLTGTRPTSDGEEPEAGVLMSREELLQLRGKTQLWPLMEGLSALNQLRLCTDLLLLADHNAEACLRRQLSRHLRFCLQSTPMNVGQLQCLWFLLSSDGLLEKLPLVWCELLSEALAALWTCSVTSDPDRWLRWDPVHPETEPGLKRRPAAGIKVLPGPAVLGTAVWSHCILGVLSSSGSSGGMEPGAGALLASSHVCLGEWKERLQQLEVVSSVLWDNMAFPAAAPFATDLRLQGAVLRRQLQSMADLLPPNMQEGYMESCESLVEDPDPLIASQEIQTVLRNFLPPNLLPDGLMGACMACLQQFVQGRVQGGGVPAHSGAFWVHMGLLQVRVWTPQSIFDPAVKRAYKLNYAQQELVLLEDEWKTRSLSSELKTGEELRESSTTDGFQHPRIAVVNEWDNQERRKREQEQMEASLYRSRSRLHGSGLTEDEQEEKDFRRQFPQFNKDFADILTQPSLEGPGDSEPEAEEDGADPGAAEPGSLSAHAMNAVVQVHQSMCLGYARSLWYRSAPPANHSKEHIKALISSHQIASPLMSHCYQLMSELDLQLTGCGLLLSTLLQNTVRGSGGSELAASPEGPYDFYQQPNVGEAGLCLPVLEQLSEAVRRRLEEWPEHPALLQLVVVMERITSFSLACPLAKFLNGLEILLAKAQDWENNASRAASLRKELEPVIQLIIQWRKLELCWSSSLDNALKRHTEKSTKHWFSLYQLVERYLEEQRTQAPSEQAESLSLSSISSTLEAFMESSTLGDFHTRLRMLLSFHCHLLLVPDLPGQSLSRLLWNLHRYYSQFSESVQGKMLQLRQPIEKELKQDFVKISKWNDVSYWSIKQSVEKTLFKFVKKFEEALSKPSLAALVEVGSVEEEGVATGPEEGAVHRVHRALKAAVPGQGRELQSLQSRLPVLFRKMKKMCIQLLKKDSVPELAEDLDQFTEIISNLRELQSLSVDAAAAKEKQKTEVKHILQQKQRALSDLFKMLSELLSYRKGVTWSRTADPETTLCMQPLEMTTALSAVMDPGETERLLAELMAAWEGCQKYFYRSWARRTALQTALQHATKELGVGNIERCRGFSSHLFKVLLRQRHRLAQLTEHWLCLPPQEPLQGWIQRGQALAAQCAALLQQLSWLLQCCPEDAQQKEQGGSGQQTPMCPSPLAAQQQPPGCLLRRGDPSWCQLHQRVVAMLKDAQTLREQLGSVAQQEKERVLCTSSFASCCSAMEQLGAVAAQISSMEHLFSPVIKVGGANSQPAVTQSLQYVRGQVETCVTEFSTWKSQLLSLGEPFSAELEANINAVLCAVQRVVKRREKEQEAEKPRDPKTVEDLLKPGHLTRLLEEELEADLEALSVGSVNMGVTELLSRMRRRRDSCQPQQLQELNRACRMLVRFEPLLGIYSDLVRHYLSVSVGVHRCTGKLLSVLSGIFTELAQKQGFCLPQELLPGGDGEGATEFHDYEGGGIGEGEGSKDVSDKIETEDQVEDTFQEGVEKEEQQDKENIKSEDNAIEMSEDFDGRVHDGEQNEAGEEEESEEEDKEELDKKMGDLGEGQTDTLDERMWGDDEDDEEEGSDKEEESGQGMREFDENEVDPFHGQQDKRPEPEAMDLPEDLNLDQDEEAGEDEENPLDIADKAPEPEEKEGEQKDGEEEEPGDTEMEENPREEEPQTEEEEEEKGQEKVSGEEEAADEEEEKEGEEDKEGREEREEATAPKDGGDKAKAEQEEEEEEEEGDDEEPASAERKEHSADGQTGEENIQSEAAVELAGAASERDQAKEEHGSGAADASQSEGHQSKLTARMASQTQTRSKTQSYKRKPGRADKERSTGDYNERVSKRLRTVEGSQERTENRQTEGQQESELYEHIKDGEAAYDAQTYVEGGEMEAQQQDEEDERPKDRQHQPVEEERAERGRESSIHTVPELLLHPVQPEELRREMELQLESWRRLAPGSQEEEAAAASMWLRYQTLTSALSQQLCEQLRLILEPTQAAKLRGDYRTGKRLNMRKVIPYIASQFRKDKIWLRRTKPSKREYQICLAVDDSSSMVDNHSKQLAFESLSVIINALTLLEVGQVSVCFGEQMQLLHPFQQQFNDESGARILRLCQFQQKKTRIAQFLETSTKMFLSARQHIPGSITSTAQLLLIVSDGRGLFLEGKERVMAAVQAARTANIFVIFVALDNPNTRDSILDIKVPVFKGPGELPEIRSYMEEFPFPFYVILRDVNTLPETLSDALRQWFELITAADQ